jgi:hypothetical protein
MVVQSEQAYFVVHAENVSAAATAMAAALQSHVQAFDPQNRLGIQIPSVENAPTEWPNLMAFRAWVLTMMTVYIYIYMCVCVSTWNSWDKTE